MVNINKKFKSKKYGSRNTIVLKIGHLKMLFCICCYIYILLRDGQNKHFMFEILEPGGSALGKYSI